MRLRQIALVAADLEPSLDQLGQLLREPVCYRDPGVGEFGLVNGLIPVGDTFLEVVSPDRDGTTAGRFLERRGGDGGYMVIVQVDDLDAERSRVADLGVREVWRHDGSSASASHWHPRDVGGAILSFDEMDPPESWAWAGPTWAEQVTGELAEGIVGVTVEATDPDAMAQRWSEVMGRSVDGDGRIALDDGSSVRVVASEGRGDGVAGIDVRVRDRDRAGEVHHLVGTAITFT